MKYYLIKIKADYADEFDVYGIKVLSEKDFKILHRTICECHNRECRRKEKILNKENSKDLPSWDDRYVFFFGTNEELRFNSVDDIENTYKIEEISEEQYNTFKELHLLSYGETLLVDIFFNGRIEEEMAYIEERWGIEVE